MVHKAYRPQLKHYLQGIICTLFAAMLLAIPRYAFANSIPARSVRLEADASPTFQVQLGFNSRFRDGNWVPVHIALQNTDTDFTGTLSVNVPTQFTGANNPDTSAIYRTPITLPTGSQKRITIYAPFSFGTSGATQNITITLRTILLLSHKFYCKKHNRRHVVPLPMSHLHQPLLEHIPFWQV